MICPVTWEPDVPDDIKAIVEPHLEHWKDLVPTWCQEFIVRYDAVLDNRMAVKVNYRNRWALLIVTGLWLGETQEARDKSLSHELIHVNLEPLVAPVVRIIEDTTKEGTVERSLADSMFSDGMEAAVEDLAQCIVRMREREHRQVPQATKRTVDI